MGNRLKFTIIVGDDVIKVYDTAHSIERFHERLVMAEENPNTRTVKQYEWDIYSMLVSLGPTILDAKNGECFGIYDPFTQIGLICQLTNEFNKDGSDISLNIITICKTRNFFVRQGQRIFEVNDLLPKEE